MSSSLPHIWVQPAIIVGAPLKKESSLLARGQNLTLPAVESGKSGKIRVWLSSNMIWLISRTIIGEQFPQIFIDELYFFQKIEYFQIPQQAN